MTDSDRAGRQAPRGSEAGSENARVGYVEDDAVAEPGRLSEPMGRSDAQAGGREREVRELHRAFTRRPTDAEERSGYPAPRKRGVNSPSPGTARSLASARIVWVLMVPATPRSSSRIPLTRRHRPSALVEQVYEHPV
jgi:hypothetical protein